MQRYDDFCNLQWIAPYFCEKKGFLLMYINPVVCEHNQIVSDNSSFSTLLVSSTNS